MAEVKLPKAQREFYGAFARNAVQNILAPILEFRGLDISQEGLDAVLDKVDLKDLTAAIAVGFNERVDFKTIVKVDKFMKGGEFLSVVQASSEVNALVQGALIEVIAPLIPLTEEEKAAKEAALADQAAG
ncbi:hypothetical protein Roomu2_00169 [Pseudomonas phage vB_PpuM-Roomu-2]|uniref:Tail assembly chaperone n=1 Tax=Pseudomonas phage vB_PpuM-Roomu-2 TaxID=3132621 RepID=A0AAX4N0Y0_9CAUD